MTTQTEPSGSFFWKAYAGVRRRVEFGDALLFLYALVFVRQYLWIIDNNFLAWAFSVPLATLCLYFYISTKEFATEKVGRSFWLLVGLPLLLAYLLRAAFPDHSYDVLSYHLLNAERTLRGPLFGPGDFFPTAFPFNPVADTLTGISRLFLGFRLGTVINLLALIWAARVTDKILRPFVSRAWQRSACVLLVVLSETLLFEISTYMVDLLTLPLMLEATLLTMIGTANVNHAERRRLDASLTENTLPFAENVDVYTTTLSGDIKDGNGNILTSGKFDVEWTINKIGLSGEVEDSTSLWPVMMGDEPKLSISGMGNGVTVTVTGVVPTQLGLHNNQPKMTAIRIVSVRERTASG